MPYETLLYEVGDDHVATVTINRPEAMNSFSLGMIDEFADLWTEIREDENVHAVVLRGAEGRAFSTGADVREDRTGKRSDNVWLRDDPGHRLGPKSMRCWKPVVTAVHGLHGGGAAYWTNESDIVICSEEAEFFDPHVTYGMTAALEPIGMRFKANLGDVLRMTLLGNDERMSAQTALRIGLVTEIVKREDLWTRAHDLAAKIAAKPPAATQGSLRAIWESLDMTRATALGTAMKYCQLGNPVGTVQVDRWALMGKGKKQSYNVR